MFWFNGSFMFIFVDLEKFVIGKKNVIYDVWSKFLEFEFEDLNLDLGVFYLYDDYYNIGCYW